MASVALKSVGKKPVRRRGELHLVDDRGAKIPESVLIGVNERYHARRLQARLQRTIKRHEAAPERQSVAIAMLAVEERLVKAFWTIARQPLGKVAPLIAVRCGIDYLHDRCDIHSIYTDAAGGKWDSTAPRPSLPSSKDISAADRVQEWLLLIDDEGLRKLLVVGATAKKGDAGRQIPWRRVVFRSLPELKDVSLTRLNARYQEALRIIVTELTIARVR